MNSSTPEGMLNPKIHAGSVDTPLRRLLSKGRVSAILNRTTYDSTYIIQTRDMNPIITIIVAIPRHHGGPRCLPGPTGSGLKESTISIEEVEGCGVSELRYHEGTVKTGESGLSAGFGGLRIGGVYVIIVMVPGVLEERLKVGRERHGKREGGREE